MGTSDRSYEELKELISSKHDVKPSYMDMPRTLMLVNTIRGCSDEMVINLLRTCISELGARLTRDNNMSIEVHVNGMHEVADLVKESLAGVY